jgi:hypothetical protein
MCGLDSSSSGYGPMTGSRKHGNVPSGATKYGVFIDYLSDHKFLNDCSIELTRRSMLRILSLKPLAISTLVVSLDN